MRSIVVIVALALVASGCYAVVPPGDAPLRYRDAVFTDVTTTSDVPYAEVMTRFGDEVTLLADVYEPTGDTVAQRPAIIWVHGGSFSSGSKTSPELIDQSLTFARKGYVNVSISYRLSPTGCSAVVPDVECLLAIQDAAEDAMTAVRWLRLYATTYGVDPDRVAIGGSSAGAITALNVGYNSFDSSHGPYQGESSQVGAAVSLSGAAVPWAAVASPDFADPGDAPALLFHNEVDPLVFYQWAVNTVDAAQAAGLVAYLVTFPGLGHVPYLQHRTQIHEQTTNFLYWMLDLLNAAQ